jgi:hypothetical protein
VSQTSRSSFATERSLKKSLALCIRQALRLVETTQPRPDPVWDSNFGIWI